VYRAWISVRIFAGRLPVVFERLDGEVNWVVTEMGIEGHSGEYSSRLLSRGGELDIKASFSEGDTRSALLARDVEERVSIIIKRTYYPNLRNGTSDSIQPRNGSIFEDLKLIAPKLTPRQAKSIIYAPSSSSATGLESDGRSPQDNSSNTLYRRM
jgi:hypothetical protein